jgi:glycylpeptide N-tetradecanoyltransferase
MNLARAKGIYKLPKETSVSGLRPMTDNDVNMVYKILNDYLSKFIIKFHFDKEEVAHWLLPRKKVVYSYVLENSDGVVTDLISFY